MEEIVSTLTLGDSCATLKDYLVVCTAYLAHSNNCDPGLVCRTPQYNPPGMTDWRSVFKKTWHGFLEFLKGPA